MNEPYFVEVDKNGCERCACGKTWTVVGPDGVALGRSWENSEDAEETADAMNAAYWAGRGSLESALEKALSELPDSDTAGSEGGGYKFAWDELSDDDQEWVKQVRRECSGAMKSWERTQSA